MFTSTQNNNNLKVGGGDTYLCCYNIREIENSWLAFTEYQISKRRRRSLTNPRWRTCTLI